MKTCILTGKNLVDDGIYRNTYKYRFPNGSFVFKDHEIAVGQVNIWNSFYTITAQKNNNKFQYIQPTAATSVTRTVVIPDGTYSVSQLNEVLQFNLIINKDYMIDGSGNYVYFMEFLWNPTAGLIELICYPLPTVAGTYTQPVGALALPSSPLTPQLVVYPYTTNLFGEVIGFAAGSFPSAAQSTIYNVLATAQDRLYPVTSLNLTCSMLYNTLALPCTLLYSFNLSSTSFGDITSDTPVEFAFVPIKDGIYNDFDITFLDQDNNPVYVRDTDLNVVLVIRHVSER